MHVASKQIFADLFEPVCLLAWGVHKVHNCIIFAWILVVTRSRENSSTYQQCIVPEKLIKTSCPHVSAHSSFSDSLARYRVNYVFMRTGSVPSVAVVKHRRRADRRCVS